MTTENYHPYYILNDQGHPEPADELAWARWFQENTDKRILARTTVGEREVSTVFLGLNHAWTAGSPPVLWETMVFPECEICIGATSHIEAMHNHEMTVGKLKHEQETESDSGNREGNQDQGLRGGHDPTQGDPEG